MNDEQTKMLNDFWIGLPKFHNKEQNFKWMMETVSFLIEQANAKGHKQGQADLIDKLTSDDAVRAGFEFFCNEKTDKDMTLEESSMWCVREIIKAAIKKASESLGADAETTASHGKNITSVRPKPEKPKK